MSDAFPAPSPIPRLPAPSYPTTGLQRSAALMPIQPAGPKLSPGTKNGSPIVPDNGFVHLLRFLLVWTLMMLSCYIVIGVIWVMISLSRTGRRKRDILMYLVPVWGTIVQVQTVWRYSAKNVYWSVRRDRRSQSLFSR